MLLCGASNLLSNKKRPVILIAILTTMLILTNYVLYHNYSVLLTKIANFIHARWREVYFLNILVFASGMLFDYFLNNKIEKQGKLIHYYIFWLLILLITISMVFLKVYSYSNLFIGVAFQIAPIVMILSLCIWALNFSIVNTIFEYLGRISYSIYLFHMSYYLLISNVGSFPENSFREFIITVSFFPVFVFICGHLEKMGNYFNRKLRELLTIKIAQQVGSADSLTARR